MADSVKTVAMLAPMVPELAPLKKKIPLTKVDPSNGAYTHEGQVGYVRVVAVITGIGTQPAKETTERLLDGIKVDHLMVVGIAGGMGPSVEIGDLVIPELVVDEATGKEVRPNVLEGSKPRGTIVTSDRFGYDDVTNAKFIADGVVGVDMETSAVGIVCEARGVPWSAYRGISDRGDDDSVDVEVLKLAGADGSGDGKALMKYLLRRPWKIFYLAKLGKGTYKAVNVAADAAIAACKGV
ncbi:MAG: 5'-methylthioadenosine/S-adenosylhomocysteine nucleosidase [Acidimicrobiia bacterium]